MRDLFPQKLTYRPADAQLIKQAQQVQQRVVALGKGHRPQMPKLWRNHVSSVMGFRRFLWRKGGVYSSFLRWVRL